MPGKAASFKVSHTRRSAPPSYHHIPGSGHCQKLKMEMKTENLYTWGCLSPARTSACAVHCRCGRTEPDCQARVVVGRARPTGCCFQAGGTGCGRINH